MKKILLIFILIFSLSFFCGCKSEKFELPKEYVYSSINFFSDGQISQSIGMSVNSKKIDAIAKRGESVQFKSNLVKQFENLRQKFLLSFAIVYLQNPIEELKIGEGVKLTPASYRQESDEVFFEMIFSSSIAWQYYHNGGNQASQEIQSNPFLIEKQSNISPFPFSGQDSNGNRVSESYKNIYRTSSEGLSFEDEVKENYKPKFIYNYTTYSNKIKSDSSYKYVDSLGQYCHIWVADEGKLEKFTTTIYYYKINKGNSLMLSLVLPLIGLCSYFVYKISKNRKRQM